MAWGREKQDPISQMTPIQATPWSRDIRCFIGCITTWWTATIPNHDCTLVFTDSLIFYKRCAKAIHSKGFIDNILQKAVCENIYLVSINGDGNQCKNRDMDRTILCKAAHMAHHFPEHPCTVNKPNLREQVKWPWIQIHVRIKKHACTCSPPSNHREMNHAHSLVFAKQQCYRDNTLKL